jgi:formamidopyrimidine-DNA glycosylase
MPELPEAETARRLAQRVLVGRRIVAVAAREDPIVFAGTSARRVAAWLRGRRVVAARRKGKHNWLELDRRPWLAFHFGMSGDLQAYRRAEDRPRFWKLELVTEDGRRLAFTDVRRFGRIRLQRDPAGEPPISRLGFDALEGLPGAAELRAVLSRRKAPLKAVLLDQAVFAGVGNWIADEVLYQARIDPRRRAGTLTDDEIRRLRTALRHVMTISVRARNDSDRYPRRWLFHDRWGRNPKAYTARGEKIRHDTIAGRTTAWVPSVQR